VIEGRDPCRIMLADELQGGFELPENDCLGFHTVAVLKADVGHRHRHGCGGAVVWRQDRFEDKGAHRIASARDVERELRSERLNAGRPAALPLRPDQAEVDAVVFLAIGWRGTPGAAFDGSCYIVLSCEPSPGPTLRAARCALPPRAQVTTFPRWRGGRAGRSDRLRLRWLQWAASPSVSRSWLR
jgi:hypothetical protein